MARPSNSRQPGLFGWQDVSAALRNGLDVTFFSLDEPRDSKDLGLDLMGQCQVHPFNSLRFAPNRMKDTGQLATMFHTDYLLKFFSTGVELSGKAPFVMKSTNEGLTKVLPERLRSVVRSCSDRGAKSVGNAHRFWIENQEIPFKQSTSSDGHSLVYRFGQPVMIVKKHLLQRDEQGRLVDAPVDDLSDNTPEASFARDFTSNYEQIGQYFPEFLRLRELSKLSAMYRILNGIANNIQEQIQDIVNQEHEIYNKILTQRNEQRREIQQKMDKALSDALSAAKSQFYSMNTGGHSWYSVESQLRNEFKSRLDSNLYNDFVKQLRSQYSSINESSLTNAVSSFIYSHNANQLASLEARAVVEEQQSRLRSTLYKLQSQYGLRVQTEQQQLDSMTASGSAPVSASSCNWVPAAFRSDGSSLIYGGVMLNPNLRQQYTLNPPPTSSYHMSAPVLNAQRANAIPGSQAQQIDNLRVHNQTIFQNQQAANHNMHLIYSAKVLNDAGRNTWHRVPQHIVNDVIRNGNLNVVPGYFNHSKPNLSNDSYNYSLPGTVNGTQGYYQVSVRPSASGRNGIITHCTFGHKSTW